MRPPKTWAWRTSTSGGDASPIGKTPAESGTLESQWRVRPPARRSLFAHAQRAIRANISVSATVLICKSRWRQERPGTLDRRRWGTHRRAERYLPHHAPLPLSAREVGQFVDEDRYAPTPSLWFQ